MREFTPVERILDLAFEPSSSKQESPGFSHGECHRLPLAPWHEHQVCRLCLNKFNKLFKEERSEQDKDTDRLHTCR